MKWLLGCALGGGALVLTCLLLGLVGWYWAMGTGDQVPSERAIHAQTRGVLLFQGDLTDPGLNAFLTSGFDELSTASEKQDARKAPESMRWLYELQTQRRSSAQTLPILVPRDLTILVDREPDGDASWYTVLNPRQSVRLFRFLLERFASASEDAAFRRIRIGHWSFFHGVDPEGQEAFTFGTVDGTVVVGRTIEGATRVVDALSRGPTPSALVDAARAKAGAWDLRGVIDNRDGILTAVMADLAEVFAVPGEAEPDDVDRLLANAPPFQEDAEDDALLEDELATDTALFRSVWFGLDVVDADTWHIRIEPEREAGVSSVDASLLLTTLCPRFVAWGVSKGVFVSCDPEVSAELAALDVNVTGWKAAFEKISAPQPTPSLEQQQAMEDLMKGLTVPSEEGAAP